MTIETVEKQRTPSRGAAGLPSGRPGAAAQRKPQQTFTKLQFQCETTGGLVEYEVPSDAGTVKDLWQRQLMLNCTHCGEVHGFAFRDAFIRGALDAADVLTLSRHV
jgi:hypothetical protein